MRTKQFIFGLPFLILAFSSLLGCGGGAGAMSKSDMLKYAMDRGGGDADAAPAPTNQPQPAPQPKPQPAAPPPTQPKPKPPSNKETKTDENAGQLATSVALIGKLAPITARQPDEVMPKGRRRAISASNMERLSRALKTWIYDDKQGVNVPLSNHRTSKNQETLSWRVLILPYLGYNELFKKFNLEEPWDSPTNKALVDYIPPEFVSPERNDAFTNYQLLVNGRALFNTQKRKRRTTDDGDKILILAEVDDNLAVPWTSPFDYDVTEDKIDHGVGHLREDGIFVGWMNGSVSLWPTPIDTTHLWNAIDHQDGIDYPYLQYAEYPPTGSTSARPSLGGASPTTSVASEPSSAANIPAMTTTSVAPSTTPGGNTTKRMGARKEVPTREQIVAAEAKMMETYGEAFASTRTPVERAKLARLIVQQLMQGGDRLDQDDDDGYAQAPRTVDIPAPELFVGLRSALNIAVKGHDPNLALQLIDEIYARFDVDRREFDGKLVDACLGEEGCLRAQANRAAVLLPLIETMINENIEQDKFEVAEKLMSYGFPVVTTLNNVETRYRWKVLLAKVEAGKKNFPNVAESIEKLAANPDDAKANHAVGWYLAFVKDNWIKGSELLAKSDVVEVRGLAVLEIQRDASINRHLQLADGWWNYARKHAEGELTFKAAMNRSRYWYMSASVGLPEGLDRIRANNRITQINQSIGPPAIDPNAPNSAL